MGNQLTGEYVEKKYTVRAWSLDGNSGTEKTVAGYLEACRTADKLAAVCASPTGYVGYRSCAVVIDEDGDRPYQVRA